MQAIKQTTFTFRFDADELARVNEALAVTEEFGIFGGTGERARRIRALINASEALTHTQADDLRVFVIRYLKATVSDDMSEWPRVLGGVANELNRLVG